MELAPQLGKQPTIEHLVPVFLNLLRDPYPDVRLNVISKLDQVGMTIAAFHLLLAMAARGLFWAAVTLLFWALFELGAGEGEGTTAAAPPGLLCVMHCCAGRVILQVPGGCACLHISTLEKLQRAAGVAAYGHTGEPGDWH